MASSVRFRVRALACGTVGLLAGVMMTVGIAWADGGDAYILLAGTGTAGFSGDGGDATAATLDQPYSAVLGPQGTVIADTANNRVRVITAGNIKNVAGNGKRGFRGDGGRATAAEFDRPQSLAIGPDGSIYIADTGNDRIRVVRSAHVSTVAGTGRVGFSGDGGPATAATLGHPQGIAITADGTLIIADTANNRIREITTAGVIENLAGNGHTGYTGDGGPAVRARLNHPSGVAVGTDGVIYFSDSGNNVIRSFRPGGLIHTLAGNGVRGYAGDGGTLAAAEFSDPTGLDVDNRGYGLIFIADTGNDRIRVIAPPALGFTVQVLTYAGTGAAFATGPPLHRPRSVSGSDAYAAFFWPDAPSSTPHRIQAPAIDDNPVSLVYTDTVNNQVYGVYDYTVN